MEAPIKPVEPGKSPADEDLVNYAMSLAIVEIKKVLKDKVCVKTSIRTWSEIAGEITITVPGNKEAWDDYYKAYDQYKSDLIDYEAEQHGVSREHYLAAREKLNEYNRKKCDKAEERTIDYYLSNTLEVPDDEIVVAS